MRPEFGCGVHDFVFDTIDALDDRQLETAIRSALDRWEPRIEVEDARLRPRRDVDDGQLIIDIGYRVRATNTSATSSIPSTSSRRRRPSEAAAEIELDDRRFQDLVSEARLRIIARVPGVDRAQRLRPRHHADRAVRVDDRDDDLPAQPRAGQAPRRRCSSCSGSASTARAPRTREPALPARRAGRPSRSLIPGGDDRGRHAAHGDATESVDLPGRRGLHDPAARPAAYVRPARRPGQGRRRRRRRRPSPQGADQLAVRRPAAGRRRAVPRLRGADSRRLIDAGRRRGLAGPRRRREPGGPAAALGGLPGGDGSWLDGDGARGPHRRLQLRLRHGRAPAAAAQRDRSRWPATACTGCAAASTRRRRRRRGDDLHAPAGDLLDHRRADRRAAAGLARRARGARDRSASPTARPARSSRCATRPCSSRCRARRSRSRTPSPATGQRWELREDFVGSTEFDRHFNARPRSSGEIEFGPAIRETDGGWTQYGAVPPKGAVLRFTRYRHGGGRDGNVAARRAQHAAQRRSPASTRSRTPSRRSAASTPSRSSTRAPARGDGDPHRATARSPPRTSSSSPARPRRASPAPSACRRSDGGAGRRCTSSRSVYPPTASSPTTSSCPTRSCCTEVAEYLDERRLIGTHACELLPCAFRGLSVVVNLQASPLADTGARRGGRRARALHVPEPAGGRQPDRARRRLGVRARAQPGRALRDRARGRRRRVREDPAHLRDEPETGEQSPKPAGTHIVLEPDELIASASTSSRPRTGRQ